MGVPPSLSSLPDVVPRHQSMMERSLLLVCFLCVLPLASTFWDGVNDLPPSGRHDLDSDKDGLSDAMDDDDDNDGVSDDHDEDDDGDGIQNDDDNDDDNDGIVDGEVDDDGDGIENEDDEDDDGDGIDDHVDQSNEL